MAQTPPIPPPVPAAPPSPDLSQYRELNIERTITTIEKLRGRIQDRFPNSGLGRVCGELLDIARQSKSRIERISRPNYWLRGGVGLLMLFSVVTMVVSISNLNLQIGQITLGELVTIFEASLNDLVLIGAAFFFLVTIEGRIKRRKALEALHELRSIAHVIDMHQLTKDPSRRPDLVTPHSPTHDLNAFQLARYLDYCSEMLALAGKVSALYAQAFPDEVVLQTINELENLTTGMSRKIWQKIMILDRMEGEI